MMEDRKNMEVKKKVINLDEAAKLLWSKKKKFLLLWLITFVLSCLWIFPQPRFYTCEVMLAPETSKLSSQDGISSIASSMGFNLGGLGEDAIYPTLYPDLFKSTDFIVSLFNIQVETKDSTLRTSYYDYMANHQKSNWLLLPYHKTINFIKELSGNELPKPGTGHGVNPFRLSKFDSDLVKGISENIHCSVDKKTDVITINVKDQDPLICATVADSVRERLQHFITEYRTHKIRIDLQHYQKAVDSTFIEYQRAIKKYSLYCDANFDVNLQSFSSKRDELENEMQLRYNTYSTMSARLDAIKVKLQERTPAFTTLKNATVPIKPAGPKRMLFVAFMLVLSSVVYSFWLMKKNADKIMC